MAVVTTAGGQEGENCFQMKMLGLHTSSGESQPDLQDVKYLGYILLLISRHASSLCMQRKKKAEGKPKGLLLSISHIIPILLFGAKGQASRRVC